MSCSSPEAGRDPAAAAAAAHPTLALGRHHHSHHHINAAITSRGRKRGGGTEGSHSWAQREREGEESSLCNHGRAVSVGVKGWGE